MIRVAVAAPYPMVRLGLIAALTQQRGDQVLAFDRQDIRIAGEAGHASELLDIVSTARPDVALIDPGSPDSELAHALLMLPDNRDVSPATGSLAEVLPLVVMVDPKDDEWGAELLRAGVRSLLPRDALPDAVVTAIIAVSQGLFAIHPELMGSLLVHPALSPTPLPAQTPVPGDTHNRILTRRESEVLQLVAQGLGNKTIAARLSLSDHTIKFHMGAIMTKLGAASRAEAVAIAARQGLILL